MREWNTNIKTPRQEIKGNLQINWILIKIYHDSKWWSIHHNIEDITENSDEKGSFGMSVEPQQGGKD